MAGHVVEALLVIQILVKVITYNNIIWLEICGDGHDFGHFECDDGNIRPGDGCNE
jgi:cysteine-rich repeat protein